MTSAAAFVALGWASTAIYVTAQAYISWRPRYSPPLYYALNAFGAAGFIASSWAIASWQSVAINAFWLIVSLLSLFAIEQGRASALSRWWVMAPLFAFAAASLFTFFTDQMRGYAMFGWTGSALYCVSYGLFAYSIITRPRFLAYNAAAAVLLLPIYAIQDNWPGFALSIIWALISASGWLSAVRDEAKGRAV